MIKDRKQILALASPVRLAVIDTLEDMGPLSVAALARTIGVKADALYYHLRILEKRGLVRRVSSADATEAVFALAAGPLILAYDAKDARNRDAVTRVAGAMVRGALRAFRTAFSGRARVTGKRRELWAAQQTARLSAAELEEVNRHLRALLETFAAARHPDSEERLYALTFVLSPYGKD
jgi:DNA-binding transcriptional ArsR family regulator